MTVWTLKDQTRSDVQINLCSHQKAHLHTRTSVLSCFACEIFNGLTSGLTCFREGSVFLRAILYQKRLNKRIIAGRHRQLGFLVNISESLYKHLLDLRISLSRYTAVYIEMEFDLYSILTSRDTQSEFVVEITEQSKCHQYGGASYRCLILMNENDKSFGVQSVVVMYCCYRDSSPLLPRLIMSCHSVLASLGPRGVDADSSGMLLQHGVYVYGNRTSSDSDTFLSTSVSTNQDDRHYQLLPCSLRNITSSLAAPCLRASMSGS